AVTQSTTGTQEISNSITVTMAKVPQAFIVCGSLAAIVDGFFKLGSVDPQNFAEFSKDMLNLDVIPFFKDLAGVVTQPVDTQLAFFTPAVRQMFTGWLQRLAGLMVSTELIRLRLLTLETYRLLVDLIMYMSCIQKADGDVDLQLWNLVATTLAGGA